MDSSNMSRLYMSTRKKEKLKEMKPTLTSPQNITKIKTTGDECTQCAKDLKRQNEERNVGGSNCEAERQPGSQSCYDVCPEVTSKPAAHTSPRTERGGATTWKQV